MKEKIKIRQAEAPAAKAGGSVGLIFYNFDFII